MQPGIFGAYPRYAKDMGCPSDGIPAGTLLSDIDFAVRYYLPFCTGIHRGYNEGNFRTFRLRHLETSVGV